MTDQHETQLNEDLDAVVALGEPNRRRLYEYVTSADDWVSRDQAADATGLERGTAVHHLDRLAADGLLDVDYRRISGREGPGAGRPAKLYRRAERDFSVALPPREYEVVGRVLAAAVDRVRKDGGDINLAVSEAASTEGMIAARAVIQGTAEDEQTDATPRGQLLDALVDRGYEPRTRDDGTIVLHNCPFHHLAEDHTELVCNMNLDLLGKTLEGLGVDEYQARLEPEEGYCCVKLHPQD